MFRTVLTRSWYETLEDVMMRNFSRLDDSLSLNMAHYYRAEHLGTPTEENELEV
jgi:hypothetical protein